MSKKGGIVVEIKGEFCENRKNRRRSAAQFSRKFFVQMGRAPKGRIF
jgi:hypothetical protein